MNIGKLRTKKFYKIYPWSGDLYNLSATFLTGLKYHFIRFGHDSDVVGSAKFVATISSRWKYKFSSSLTKTPNKLERFSLDKLFGMCLITTVICIFLIS